MGSGFIYIVIVGMWLAYFLPRWISNHEEVSGRSIERFANTMKLMGKTAGNLPTDMGEIEKRKQRELSNRRVLFTAIIAFTLVVSLLIAVGLLSPAIAAIPFSTVGLYLVHARHQITTINLEIEKCKNSLAGEGKVDRYADLIKRSQRVANRSIAEDEDFWTPLVDRIGDSKREPHGITILPKGSAERSNTWEPISVPIPSYQRATKAAPRRRIDLTRPNRWLEANEEKLFDAIAPTPDKIFDQQLAEEAAEQIRTYRAANE